MGIFINLYVNYQDISIERWEDVYRESLVLLERFPAPLVRLKAEKKDNHRRLVLTSTIIAGQGTDNENWKIVGDSVSGQLAEGFGLHRIYSNCRHYNDQLSSDDILLVEEDAIRYSQCNGQNLFGGKTQGYPYHLALLAVGMLLEARFPLAVHVSGDINKCQVQHMLQWSNAILDKPVTEPVCVDGEGLYRRLNQLYADKSLVIKRFKTLYRGVDEEGMRILSHFGDRQEVVRNFSEELGNYADLNRLGAGRLISIMLSADKDIGKLIDTVTGIKTPDGHNKFTLEELLKLLVRHFVTIDTSERDILRDFIASPEKLMNREDVVSRIFMKFGGMHSMDMDYFISGRELLDIFSSFHKEKSRIFEKIIAREEAACRKHIAMLKAVLDELNEKLQNEAAVAAVEKSVSTAGGQAGISRPDSLSAQDYILNQIHDQTKKYEEPENSAGAIGAGLRKIISENPTFFDTDNRNEILAMIYRAIYEQRFALYESAWNTIDKEDNIYLLKCILALSMIKNREVNFWDWRKYILNHRQLWKLFSPRSEGEASLQPST